MSRQQDDYSNILDGASDTLKLLWEKRDAALKYEKINGVSPRTSDRYAKAQQEIDLYFSPIEPKANRKKPKKKTYIPEDGWAY
jgi:hypothetical protein